MYRQGADMSDYDSMDISDIADPRITLLCARLQLRSGKRRLQQGYSAAGMAGLYNAVLFGMHHYIARYKDCTSLVETVNLWDAPALFHALARAGVFEDALTFHRLSLVVERSLWQEPFSFDVDSVLAEVETMLSKLGVIPFHESALPGKSPFVH
jgi:hypothetical protein